MERMSEKLMTNKVKEHTGFHYQLTEIQVCTLILLELNIFFKMLLSKIKDKYITRNIFWIQPDDSIMCEFYCNTFIEYMISGNIVRLYKFILPNDYEKNGKIIYKYFKGYLHYKTIVQTYPWPL